MARQRRPLRSWFLVLAVSVLGAGAAGGGSRAAEGPVFESALHRFKVVTITRGLDHPWALAFLPDGTMLVTERPGRLRLVRDGVLDPAPVPGVPEVAASGQGGLLDVALHPDFATNRWVYLSYAGKGRGGAGTEVARGRFVDGRLEGLMTIFSVRRKSHGGRHFGSRLVFGADGTLYITAGERGDSERAQDPLDAAGSVIRVTDTGTAPADNPYRGRSDTLPEIFSIGHRNPQGLARHPETGRIWAVEHGPRGGDELNLLRPGANYGWPVITYGKSYAGSKIGEGTAKPGMEQPVTYWVPSISPSGLAFYSAEAFPRWRGSLFLGALSGEMLVRLELDGERVVREERLLEDLEARIRDVRQGPDGRLYLLTDESDGALLRLDPVP